MNEALSPEIMAQLDQLRDIRLPEPVGWWPLAHGWWGLLALIGVLTLMVLVVEYRRRRSTRYLALKELDDLPLSETTAFAAEVSSLLRRVSRQRSKGADVLTGEAWAEFLSDRKNGMPRDLADFLSQGPYANPANDNNAPDLDRLRSEAARWIRRHA